MDSGIDIPWGAVFNDGVDLDLGRGSSVGRYWYRRDLWENTALWFSAWSSLGDGIYLDDYLEDYSFGIVLLLIIIYVVQIRYFVDVFYSVFFKKHEQEQPTPNSQ